MMTFLGDPFNCFNPNLTLHLLLKQSDPSSHQHAHLCVLCMIIYTQPIIGTKVKDTKYPCFSTLQHVLALSHFPFGYKSICIHTTSSTTV